MRDVRTKGRAFQVSCGGFERIDVANQGGHAVKTHLEFMQSSMRWQHELGDAIHNERGIYEHCCNWMDRHAVGARHSLEDNVSAEETERQKR
jgi:hypothetical protein